MIMIIEKQYCVSSEAHKRPLSSKVITCQWCMMDYHNEGDEKSAKCSDKHYELTFNRFD